jgi:hypothetical protein
MILPAMLLATPKTSMMAGLGNCFDGSGGGEQLFRYLRQIQPFGPFEPLWSQVNYPNSSTGLNPQNTIFTDVACSCCPQPLSPKDCSQWLSLLYCNFSPTAALNEAPRAQPPVQAYRSPKTDEMGHPVGSGRQVTHEAAGILGKLA